MRCGLRPFPKRGKCENRTKKLQILLYLKLFHILARFLISLPRFSAHLRCLANRGAISVRFGKNSVKTIFRTEPLRMAYLRISIIYKNIKYIIKYVILPSYREKHIRTRGNKKIRVYILFTYMYCSAFFRFYSLPIYMLRKIGKAVR